MIRSRNRLLRKYCEGQYYFYSFFIPAFIMFIIFLILQIHPLGAGTNMVLTVDCYHQYAPFLVELRNKILSGESLFFSWNVGMGTNFWAVLANYSASPLNIISIFFTPKYVGDCVALIAIIRVGLTGLFMSILLKEFDKKRKDLLLVAFASSYALCGWVAAYFWNIMWHDAVMLLPLIVYGLIKTMRDKKPLLYCLSLAVCLISNFYSGYFVCLFLVIYAPILYITITERVTIKNLWSAVWRFALYSGIGGGISAFLTLSTFFTLQQSSATGGTFPKEFQVTNDLFDFISRFFVGSNPNIRDGMANVYCGILVIMMVPLYFLCKKIRLREKIAYGIGLAVMYISLSSRMMTYIWHGFHFPNQIPYRNAFLISFLVVIMGYKVLRNLKSFSKGELLVPCLSMIAYLILYEKIGEGQDGYIAMGISIVFVIIYTAMLRMIANGKKSAMFQQIALFFVLVVEIFTSSAVTISLVAAHEGFTGWDFYGSRYNEIQTLLTESEAQNPYGFERSEIYPAYICNQPALYNMKGISIFTSTARESFVKFISNLGFHNNGINSMRNFGMTEVTGTLFGVRNMFDLNKSSPIPACFKEIECDADIRHFKNEDSLSVAYMVDPAVIDYHMNQTSVPFLSNNAFVKSLGIENDVFEPVELSFNSVDGAKADGGTARTGYKYTFEGTKAEFSLTMKDANIGDHLYLYVVANKAPSVTINDQEKHSTEIKETKYTARTYQFMDLGYYEKNTNKLVTLKFNDSGLSGNIWIQCARVVEPAYEEMVEKLSDEQMKVLSYDSSHLEGTITAKTDGALFLTIPYDESWEATVDGQPAELIPIDNAFMAIRLTAGTHNIYMTYHPNRFQLSCYVTYASLAALFFLTIIRKILEHFRLKKMFATDTEKSLPVGEVLAEESVSEASEEKATSTETSENPEGTEETGKPEETDTKEAQTKQNSSDAQDADKE